MGSLFEQLPRPRRRYAATHHVAIGLLERIEGFHRRWIEDTVYGTRVQAPLLHQRSNVFYRRGIVSNVQLSIQPQNQVTLESLGPRCLAAAFECFRLSLLNLCLF